ncbi:hypothetical protein JXM83_00200 [Candidatus Woesearchaeota archaeon]|nr:hypothetical protein [Candidatus Woesearchaeota archaeon]
MKKRGATFTAKKGLSQVDWAISLGIFMLFLASFFVFIIPNLPSVTRSESLIYLLESGLDSYYWNVYRIPLFVKTNRTVGFNEFEPFFAPISLNPSFNYSFQSGRHFQKSRSGIVFLANMSEEYNIFWMVKSVSSYPSYYGFYDLISSYTRVQLQNTDFLAELDSGMVNQVYYGSEERIKDVSLKVGGKRLVNSLNYSSTPIFAEYYTATNSFNYSQMIFANNPAVYNIFKMFDNFGNTFLVDSSFELDGYDRYYANNQEYGTLYNFGDCYNFSTSFLTFYDNTEGLVFVFSSPVWVDFCVDEGDLIQFSFLYNMSEDFNYKYIFFTGNYEIAQTFSDTPAMDVGISENLYGLNLDLLYSFNKTVDEVKDEWGFPDSNDFRIVIFDPANKNYYFDYKTAEPDASVDIYAKEYNDYILDKYGNLTRVSISLMTW